MEAAKTSVVVKNRRQGGMRRWRTDFQGSETSLSDTEEEAIFFLYPLSFLAGPENDTDMEAVSKMYMYITQKSL